MLQERNAQRRLENQKKFAKVNVYVKNLAETVDKARFEQEFGKFGQITSAVVVLDPATQKSRGFGYVCFTTPEQAQQAISSMNGAILDGKPLYVALHQRKEERRAFLEQQFSRQRVPQMYPGYGYMANAFAGIPGRQFFQQQVPQQFPQQQQRRMGPQYFQQQMTSRPYQLTPAAMDGGRQMGHNSPHQQQRRPYAGQNRQPSGPRPPTQRRQAESEFSKTLATMAPEQQKQFLGEQLFPLIGAINPHYAGKITGMLLEMDGAEIINLIEDREARHLKVQEALAVLQTAPAGS